MSLLSFCQYLENTGISIAIREGTWLFPIIESVHVLGLCLFVGLAVCLDLRLLGITLPDVPMSDVTKRLMPWITAGFFIMIISGVLTFMNQPVKYYLNIFFRIKIAMLLLAGFNAWFFHAGPAWRKVAAWDRDRVTPIRAKIAGTVSLVLWACIVVAGRMIAYNWFDKK
jgi:hypothetical protein